MDGMLRHGEAIYKPQDLQAPIRYKSTGLNISETVPRNTVVLDKKIYQVRIDSEHRRTDLDLTCFR